MRTLRLTLPLLLSLGWGCGGSSTEASVMPRWDLTQTVDRDIASEKWLAVPFPADHRRLANGHVDLSDFPNPTNAAQLTEWITDAEAALDGFSTQGLAYFAFDGAIDVSNLPTDAVGFTAPGSPVYLVDVDPDSPEYGRRIPLRSKYWSLSDLPDTYYVAHNTLGIGPEFGFPLRESTTYAVVVTDAMRAADGGAIGQHPLVRALLRGQARAPSVTPTISQAQYDEVLPTWAPLRSFVNDEAIDVDTIVTATVFTTQTITRDLSLVASQIVAAPAPAFASGFATQAGGLKYRNESFQWNATDTVQFRTYEGSYVAPNYMEGTMPYQDVGGDLHFVNGVPTKVFDETMNFVLTVPATLPAGPCVPIVIYQHGTGGSRNSFRNDRTAGRLAARGVAAISIDQPMHGLRNTTGTAFNEELMTFNFFNAPSFRSVFRQGAIDIVTLRKFVADSLAIAAADSHTGQDIAFCDDRISFMGHSQGGLTGALGAPFVPEIDAWMFSGAGGGLAITIVNRKDFVDFQALIAYYLDIPVEEALDEEHPAATFIQMMADISEPLNYAPYWNRETRYRSPASVLLTNGTLDEATPYRTATALALAAYMPITNPVVVPIPAYSAIGLAPFDATVASPVSNNRNGATLGFAQFTDDLPFADYATHFLVFHRPEAIDLSMHFLQTASFGVAPELRRDPNSTVR